MKRIDRHSIEAIAGIVTGDKDIAPYRRWKDLESFWPDLDIETQFCDLSDATSRLKHVIAVLSHYNKLDSMRYEVFNKIITEILNPRIFELEENKEKSRELVVEYLNRELKYNQLTIKASQNPIKGLPNIYKIYDGQSKTIKANVVNKLEHRFIQDQYEKSQEKIKQGDFDGAINNARTLAEAIMKELLKKYDYSDDDLEKDLDDLYKLVKRKMNLSSKKDTEQVFKQILTGLQSLISGFSSLGNKMSERHATKYRASKHHAELAVNSCYTICEFLLSSYEHQKDN